MAELLNIRLSTEAAIVIKSWLETVPVTAIPVIHPSDRQALTDLLSELEQSAPIASTSDLADARQALLRDAGDWVNSGATYTAGQ